MGRFQLYMAFICLFVVSLGLGCIGQSTAGVRDNGYDNSTLRVVEKYTCRDGSIVDFPEDCVSEVIVDNTSDLPIVEKYMCKDGSVVNLIQDCADIVLIHNNTVLKLVEKYTCRDGSIVDVSNQCIKTVIVDENQSPGAVGRYICKDGSSVDSARECIHEVIGEIQQFTTDSEPPSKVITWLTARLAAEQPLS